MATTRDKPISKPTCTCPVRQWAKDAPHSVWNVIVNKPGPHHFIECPLFEGEREQYK